jgi:hypothetical protein
MQTNYGIVPTANGQYTLVTLTTDKHGVSCACVKRWNCDDSIKTALLLHRGVWCGLPAQWKSMKSRLAEHMRITETIGKAFSPGVLNADLIFHQTALKKNCTAVIADDAFLCTAPLFMDPLIHSFITLYPRTTHCEVGITIGKELVAVFKMSPCSHQALEGHVRRIKEYFLRTCPHLRFPEQEYLLTGEVDISNAPLNSCPLKLRIGDREFTNDDEIRALGAALAQKTGGVPEISGPSAASDLRLARTGLYAASVAVAITALLIAGLFFTAGKLTAMKLKSEESRFRSTLTNNKDLKDLLTENEALAKTILRLSEKSTAKTSWGQFLNLLGAQRPDGLYFELLGSEPIKGSSGMVRIAVSGWARNQKLAADFIARLQKADCISNITLSSMEKNDKKPNICNFKILCILKIARI